MDIGLIKRAALMPSVMKMFGGSSGKLASKGSSLLGTYGSKIGQSALQGAGAGGLTGGIGGMMSGEGFIPGATQGALAGGLLGGGMRAGSIGMGRLGGAGGRQIAKAQKKFPEIMAGARDPSKKFLKRFGQTPEQMRQSVATMGRWRSNLQNYALPVAAIGGGLAGAF